MMSCVCVESSLCSTSCSSRHSTNTHGQAGTQKDRHTHSNTDIERQTLTHKIGEPKGTNELENEVSEIMKERKKLTLK